jgi:hypothetical protein
MANTGTDVTRTEIGKRILTMMVSTLFWSEAASVARISDEPLIRKLEAPIKPTMRYVVTHMIREYEMTLCIETVRDSSFMKDGTVVIWWNQ